MALAACSPGEPSVGDTLVAAPDRVREQGSATMVMTIDTSFHAQGEQPLRQRTRAESSVDFGAERGSMRMEMDVPPELLGGIELTPCTMVLDGTSVYLNVEADETFEELPWVRADAATVSGTQLSSFGAADPTGPLEFLKGAGGEATEQGTEEIGGVTTTRYRTTITSLRLQEQADADRRDQLLDQLRQLGRDVVPVDAWIDDEGLLRRMRIEVERTGEVLTRTVMTMELENFGEPVDIDVPPDDEVFDTDDQTVAQQASSACLGIPVDAAPPPPDPDDPEPVDPVPVEP